MNWTNIGLVTAKNKDAEHFTTESGIRFRQNIYPFMKYIIKKSNNKKIYLISYPFLDENQNYIFASGHSFPDDIATNLAVIDRPTYTLIGTTDQVDHNPQMYFLWINGMIYVNKLDPLSRKESYKKMLKVLQNGSSVLMYPEGVLNNSENLLCSQLYPGFYHLSRESEKLVVPIVAHYDYDYGSVYLAADNPVDFKNKEKKEALLEMRDKLATLRFNLSRLNNADVQKMNKVMTPEEFLDYNPELIVELERKKLTGDIHQKYMEHRREIYNEVKWTTNDAWDEEIMSYDENDFSNIQNALSYIDNIDLSAKNDIVREVLGPVLKRRLEYKKYDFKDYMKRKGIK